MPNIGQDQFSEILEAKLGDYFNRALTVYKNYGLPLSWDVSNVLLHAVDQNKVEEVLAILEKHWESNLKLQHPDIRGGVYNSLGINETELMFINLCEDTLNLKEQ